MGKTEQKKLEKYISEVASHVQELKIIIRQFSFAKSISLLQAQIARVEDVLDKLQKVAIENELEKTATTHDLVLSVAGPIYTSIDDLIRLLEEAKRNTKIWKDNFPSSKKD